MVESKADTPRSYNISTDRGQQLRRNRRHLMKTTENRVPEPDVFYDCQEEIQNDNSVSNNNISNQEATKKFTSSGREVKISGSVIVWICSGDLPLQLPELKFCMRWTSLIN